MQQTIWKRLMWLVILWGGSALHCPGVTNPNID